MDNNEELEYIENMIELNNQKIEELRLYLVAYNSAGFLGKKKWGKVNKEFQSVLENKRRLENKKEDILYGTHNEEIEILSQRIEKLKKLEHKAAIRIALALPSNRELRMNNYIKAKELLEETENRIDVLQHENYCIKSKKER